MNRHLSTLTLLALASPTTLCAAAQSAPPATTTTLTVTVAGQPVSTINPHSVVTLTATVKAGTTPLTRGQVNFCDASANWCTDIHLLATAQLTASGTATYKFTPGPGWQSYQAVFLGTHLAAPSSSSRSHLPPGDAPSIAATGQHQTTSTLVQTGAPGNYTLSATIAGVVVGNSVPSPTGTISFADTSNAGTILASANLDTPGQNFLWKQSQKLQSMGSTFLVFGDFDQNGSSDIAVSNQDPHWVETWLNNGDGTFREGYFGYGSTYPNQTGNDPVSMAVADFNSDGKTDVATANFEDNTVTILFGNRDGVLNPVPVSPATGNHPSSIAIADFNGDGLADLAVSNNGSSTVTILLGKGDGTFTTKSVSPATGPDSRSIVAADLNGDGKPDLAIVSAGSNSLTILLGKGDGTFNHVLSPATGKTPTFLVAADFNGDGKIDLATANSGDDTLTILLGNGDGTFTPAPSPSVGKSPVFLAIGDLNHDGKVDFSVVNSGDRSFSTLIGNGDGTFSAHGSFTAGSWSTPDIPIAVGLRDVSGDGKADIIALAVAPFAGVAICDIPIEITQIQQWATATATGVALPGTAVHLVTAGFPGDSIYAPSTSAPVPLPNLSLSLSTSSISFGSEYVGLETPRDIVTLTNDGNGLDLLNSIALHGPQRTQFLYSTKCGPSLAPGQSCLLRARFAPLQPGAFAATLGVTDNVAGSPHFVSLTGTAITATTITLSPTSIAFAPQDIATMSPVQTATLTNIGPVPLNIASINDGAAPYNSLFANSNNCPATLTVSASCTLRFRFTPFKEGAYRDAIVIVDNSLTSPQTIQLSGTTTHPPVLTLSAASFSFGTQTIGTDSALRTITLTNTGGGPLTIYSIAITGEHPAQYLTNNNCTSRLSVGESCRVRLRFRPMIPGELEAAWTISSNAAGYTQSVSLAGEGVEPPPR